MFTLKIARNIASFKGSVILTVCTFANGLTVIVSLQFWKRDTGPTAQDGGMGVERHGAAQEGTILSQLLQRTLLMLPGAQSTPEMCSQSTEDPNSLGQMTGDSPAFQYLEQRKKF